MAWLLKDIDGKTIVQVAAPVSIKTITIKMNEADSKRMTQNELASIVDQILNQMERHFFAVNTELCLSGWPGKIPVTYSIQGTWDTLPVDDMEIQYVDDGCFEELGDEV